RISVLDVFYCPKNFETVANLILKCAIEFYLLYEDVQNALKESAQTPFIRTKDEWVVGNNECKLNKAQKRMLKDKEIYNHFNLENIPSSIKTELNKIVHGIDD
ncbi:hypothetical protein EFM09_05545, partial [Latilactobacillus curvatus]|uniref:hypothetical protein n=1 Tax=Latilactobacillus curvatus TaxID=28038 RepID=UPI00223AAB1A